jgi:hypothetical protein
MADHVPLQARGASPNFYGCFLDFVLAENAQAKRGGLPDSVGGLSFAHGKQENGRRIASGASAGSRDPLLDLAIIVGNRHAGNRYKRGTQLQCAIPGECFSIVTVDWLRCRLVRSS